MLPQNTMQTHGSKRICLGSKAQAAAVEPPAPPPPSFCPLDFLFFFWLHRPPDSSSSSALPGLLPPFRNSSRERRDCFWMFALSLSFSVIQLFMALTCAVPCALMGLSEITSSPVKSGAPGLRLTATSSVISLRTKFQKLQRLLTSS